MAHNDDAPKTDPARHERDGWMERVLDVDFSSMSTRETLEKLVSMPRPDRAPSKVLTASLLSTAKKTVLPEDDADLPEHLTAFAGQFLGTVMDEPPMSAQSLDEGAPIPAQDQMLSVAGLLDSLGRKLDSWNAALDQADDARKGVESARPENIGSEEYFEAVESYNSRRIGGIQMQAEVEAVLKEIRAACRGLAESGEEASL